MTESAVTSSWYLSRTSRERGRRFRVLGEGVDDGGREPLSLHRSDAAVDPLQDVTEVLGPLVRTRFEYSPSSSNGFRGMSCGWSTTPPTASRNSGRWKSLL